MLMLSRYIGESIVVDHRIVVKVLDVGPGWCELRFTGLPDLEHLVLSPEYPSHSFGPVDKMMLSMTDGNKVRLAFHAPRSVTINRAEIEAQQSAGT